MPEGCPARTKSARLLLSNILVPRFPIPAEPQPPWGPRSFHVSSISSTSSRVSPSCRTGRETSASRYRRKRPPSLSIENKSLEASSRKCASRFVSFCCIASILRPGRSLPYVPTASRGVAAGSPRDYERGTADEGENGRASRNREQDLAPFGAGFEPIRIQRVSISANPLWLIYKFCQIPL